MKSVTIRTNKERIDIRTDVDAETPTTLTKTLQKPITSSEIHPEWPSVSSLKGVFNKQKIQKTDPDQLLPTRKSRTYGNSQTSSDSAPVSTKDNATSEPKIAQIPAAEPVSVPLPVIVSGNFLAAPAIKTDRKKSIESLIQKIEQKLESPTPTRKNYLGVNVNTNNGTVNRRGSYNNGSRENANSISSIVTAVTETERESVQFLSISSDRELNKRTTAPIPKNRTDKTAGADVEDIQITMAAMKVTNAFGKISERDSDQLTNSTKPPIPKTAEVPVPIPKSRSRKRENDDDQKITTTTSEDPRNAIAKSEKPISTKVNQNGTKIHEIRQTKENRLGIYSKDIPKQPSKQPPTEVVSGFQFTKPVASVQPTEIAASRERKISAIVEKWPPTDSVTLDIDSQTEKPVALVHSNNSKPQIQDSKFDVNNNVNEANSILSENNRSKKTKLKNSVECLDKFASILVIGLSGSGKSSMIDELLDDQVPRNKDEIVEHTVQVKSQESEDGFYNLRIIDTPGFKSEKFGSSFARMFATLLHYCRSQEGIRGKSPNLVLFVVSFDERFFENENCDLVNFLKVIHHFENYFKNPKFPNFIFVLTHLANAPRRDQLYPQVRIHEFIDVIKKYTTLTNPISVICAENQGEAAGLQVEDGFYKLPNGELYPSNLIQEMKMLLTRKGHISLSETIIRTAFGSEYPNSIYLSATKIIPQIKEGSPIIPQIKQTLKNIYSQIKLENTEISTLLNVGWENISPDLQNAFASSLLTTKQVFQLRKISNFGDVPTEIPQVFKLLRELPQNLAVADLLIHTLQLKIPHNLESLFIGQGYDLSQDRGTNMSPFHFSNILKTSPIGQIPNELHCHITEDRAIVFKFFYSSEDYVLDRMKEIGIRHASFPGGNLPMPNLKRPGYNIIKENQEPTKSTVATALLEYRTFRLTLQETDDFEFKDVFWDALSSQPQLDSKIPETVQVWKEFFGCWGTHLVKSAFGGGSVEINFKGKMLAKVFSSLNQADTIPSDEDMTNRVFQWITGDGLDFAFAGPSEVKPDFLSGLDFQTTLQGGDDKFMDVDFTKLTYGEVSEMRNEWKESLFLRPVMLETNLVLVPISYFVKQKCEVTALKMDMAFHYIYSQFMTQSGTKNSSCSIL